MHRVVFMGSPAFAVPALQRLTELPVTVVGVVSQPDRPAGRGRKMTPPPVAAEALRLGLPLYQPRKVRDGQLQRWLDELAVDVAVVAAYGRILPLAVLETPRLGCVNLHASLLPRWRGASPIQRAIASQDASTGVCLMAMDEGLDTGAVYAKVETQITQQDDAASLSERLSQLSASLLEAELVSLLEGRLSAVPQPSEGVTYAPLLTKDEGAVPWTEPASRVHAHIRAMNPWPGAWSQLVGGERWKFFPAGLSLDERSGAAGELLHISAEGALIGTGEGSIWLRQLQRPGKRRMDAADALRGGHVAVGARFGA